jgi:hypothetical protein
MTRRQLTPLDLLVAAMTVIGIALIWFADKMTERYADTLTLVYGAIHSVLLVTWMMHDGCNSILWARFPPYWPWGLILRSRAARWSGILLFVAAIAAGLVVMVVQPDGVLGVQFNRSKGAD